MLLSSRLVRSNMSVNYVGCVTQVKQEKPDTERASFSKVDEVDKVVKQLESVTINAKSAAAEFHEYLTKRGVKWEYKEISSSGADHQKLFEVEVVFESYKFRGTGNQKKIAKQNAAAIALEALKKNPSLLSVNEVKAPSETSSMNGDAIDNPVSKLMEFCAKNKLTTPEFVVTYEYTPPNAPFFKISCSLKLLNIIAEGSGSTKITAKRNAARAALVEIELKGIFTESPQKPKTKAIDNQNSETLAMMKMKFLEELEAIPFDDGILNSIRDEKFDCNNFLMQIMNQKIDYLELDLMHQKEYRCVCQLFIDEHKQIPIFVTWGKSTRSMEEAKQLACRRAIYILISSRNP